MFKSEVDRAGFIQRLGRLIHHKGLTHRAAARELGLAETQMSRYFLGQIPEPGKLLRIAQWGGCTLEWLLTGQETPRPVPLMSGGREYVGKSDPSIRDPQLALLLDRWEGLDSASKHRLTTLFALMKDPALHDQLFLVLDVLPLLAPPAQHRVKLSVVARRLATPLAIFTIACTKHLSLKDRERFWDLFLKKAMVGAGLTFDLELFSELLRRGHQFRLAVRTVALNHMRNHILYLSSAPADEARVHETVDTLLSIASATPREDLSQLPSWTKARKQALKDYAFTKLLEATTGSAKKREWNRLVAEISHRLMH